MPYDICIFGMSGWSKTSKIYSPFSLTHCQTKPATDWVILPLFHKTDHYKGLSSFEMFPFLSFEKMHLTKQWTFSEQCIAASDSIIWFAAHPPFMWRSIVNSSLFNCAPGFLFNYYSIVIIQLFDRQQFHLLCGGQLWKDCFPILNKGFFSK